MTTWAGLTVYIYLFTHLVSFHHVPKQLYDIFSDVFFNTVDISLIIVFEINFQLKDKFVRV